MFRSNINKLKHLDLSLLNLPNELPFQNPIITDTQWEELNVPEKDFKNELSELVDPRYLESGHCDIFKALIVKKHEFNLHEITSNSMHDFMIKEAMMETSLSFSIPLQSLNLCLEEYLDERELALSENDKTKVDIYEKLCKVFALHINFITKLMKNKQSYKSARRRQDFEYRFIPTNLMINYHEMFSSEHPEYRLEPYEERFNVTFGMATDHVGGYNESIMDYKQSFEKGYEPTFEKLEYSKDLETIDRLVFSDHGINIKDPSLTRTYAYETVRRG